MGISLIQIAFLAFMGLIVTGCGGAGGGSSESLNQPALPPSPISRLELGDNFVGFIIGTQPLTTDPTSANNLKFTQQLYELDALNNITPVPMYDLTDTLIDLTGNLSYIDEESVVPLDIMVLSPDYLLMAVYHRNFDSDPFNDHFNLLIDLHDGSVTAAPVGLNPQGNSGRSSLTQLGRDVFPPDSRWNATDDLYVISIDYEELGLMSAADYEPDTSPEIVDHHNGVPCPIGGLDQDTADEDTTDESTTDTATEGESDASETTTEEATEETATDTAVEETATDTTVTAPSGATCSETINTEDLAQSRTSQISRALDLTEELPTPTAIYRMDLYEGNQYSLEKVSAVDDRPGLGQVVINDNGVIVYRNEDGGDNSLRVLLPHCETETGRLSTVMLAPYITLIVAPDQDNINRIFEVTESGMNRLEFSCNGNVKRLAYTAYSTIRALKLPFNSPSITPYDYAYPYLINTSCQSANLFPSSTGYTTALDPMPLLVGARADDVRGIRKSQMFDNHLYCIGYDASLILSIAELNPTDRYPQYEFLNYDFSAWLPDFDTIHVLSNGHTIFTGTTRVSPEVRTIMMDTNGVETDLGNDLAGLKVGHQIEIVPPGLEYTLPATTESEADTETANQTP